ncbi:hypothetical protein [Stappia sp.]|uniref:hypothetical protein n=1 Tax=Stappia sp. TaxID=1870903 RepID=UPI0032D972A2
MCPSFTGTDLRDAIEQATRRDNTARCAQLRSRARALKERAEDLKRELGSLKRELENYRAARSGGQENAVLVGISILGSLLMPASILVAGLLAFVRFGAPILFGGAAAIGTILTGVADVKQALNMLDAAERSGPNIQAVLRTIATVEAKARGVQRDLRVLESHAVAYGCNDETS